MLKYQIAMFNPFGKPVLHSDLNIPLSHRDAIELADDLLNQYPECTVKINPVFPGSFVN